MRYLLAGEQPKAGHFPDFVLPSNFAFFEFTTGFPVSFSVAILAVFAIPA